MPLYLLFVLTMLLLACPPTTTGDDDDTDDDSSTPEPSPSATPIPMPADPAPFSVTLSSGETLNFTDSLGCFQYTGSPDFRQRWQTSDNWVLVLEVFGIYAGPGTYNEGPAFMGAQASIQQNTAGGVFYQAQQAFGHTLTFNLPFEDGERAWGDVLISGFREAASGAAMTITPDTLPVWCDTIEH